MLKRVAALFTIALLLVTGISFKTASAKTAKKVKVGFIYIGSASDGGWSQAHDVARKALEKQLKVATVYKESVPEGPQVNKVVEDMIDQGANVIFATSFGYMEYIAKLAKKYPDVYFFHCSGSMSGKNFANYFGRIEEPRYLSGIVAGLKTKTNKIGYVAAFPIAECIRGINAFTLGVRSVNPKATVNVTWTNTWYDPTKEKEAAKALIDQKCDVITQHQDSAGPQLAAQDAGKFSIGYDSDMSKLAPKSNMTSPVFNWAPYYISQVKAIMNGTWKSENYWGGMKDGAVDLAPLTANAPAAAVKKVNELKAKIMKGSFDEYSIFSGPLKDQTGKVRVQKGKHLNHDQIFNMDWFVQGVNGSAKSN